MNTVVTDAEVFAERPLVAGPFEFRGPGGGVAAGGAMTAVARGSVDTLDQRVAQAFAQAPAQDIIGGALPFRRSDADYLFCAKRIVPSPQRAVRPPEKTMARDLRANPSASRYGEAVAQAVALMRQETGQPEALRKIVLARTLELQASDPIAVDALLERLGEDDSVTAFRVALPQRSGPATQQPTARALVGATPELLVEKRGARVLSYPLAGSARRSRDMVADAAAAAQLAASDKDRREHAMVVDYILDLLAPYCRELSRPDGTRLTCSRSMWHLGTRIAGVLKDTDTPSVLLASILHPTPAVCGLPCQRAAELIETFEPVSRDFYAGAVGWCDRDGDGAWYVAIRCAEIAGHQARLYAGAGIVDGSDPMAEAAETGSKFAAMLQALGLPADLALPQ